MIATLDVIGTVFFSVATTKGLISLVAAVISFVAVFVALTKHNPLIPILFAIAAGVVAGRFGLLT